MLKEMYLQCICTDSVAYDYDVTAHETVERLRNKGYKVKQVKVNAYCDAYDNECYAYTITYDDMIKG